MLHIYIFMLQRRFLLVVVCTVGQSYGILLTFLLNTQLKHLSLKQKQRIVLTKITLIYKILQDVQDGSHINFRQFSLETIP